MNDKNVTALNGQEISHLLHISQGYHYKIISHVLQPWEIIVALISPQKMQ